MLRSNTGLSICSGAAITEISDFAKRPDERRFTLHVGDGCERALRESAAAASSGKCGKVLATKRECSYSFSHNTVGLIEGRSTGDFVVLFWH